MSSDRTKRAIRRENAKRKDSRPTGPAFTRSVFPYVREQANAGDDEAALAAWLKNAQFTDVSHLMHEED